VKSVGDFIKCLGLHLERTIWLLYGELIAAGVGWLSWSRIAPAGNSRGSPGLVHQVGGGYDI
jgi:hypothetical protein